MSFLYDALWWKNFWPKCLLINKKKKRKKNKSELNQKILQEYKVNDIHSDLGLFASCFFFFFRKIEATNFRFNETSLQILYQSIWILFALASVYRENDRIIVREFENKSSTLCYERIKQTNSRSETKIIKLLLFITRINILVKLKNYSQRESLEHF